MPSRALVLLFALALAAAVAPPSAQAEPAQVRAVNEETYQASSSSVADALGRYRILGLGPGTWHVTASTDRRWTAGEVTLKPGAEEAQLDLTFPVCWPVRGRVVDRNGTPIVGATLVFLHSEAPQRTDSSYSDPDGNFSLLLPDGTYEVKASAGGYAETAAADPVTVAGAALGGVEVRLAAGTRLTGRVLGLTPEELAETSVTANQAEALETARLDDRDGSYVIEHLIPGNWTVSAHYLGELAVAPLHVAPGEVQAALDLTFVRGPLTLRGRLRGGDPLARYVADLSRVNEPEVGLLTSVLDGQGFFGFTQLRPGRYRLTVQDSTFTSIGGGPAYDRVIELTEDCELEIELPAAAEDPGAV